MTIQSAFDYYVNRGWSREQSAGIVGNLYYESGGLNPTAVGDGGRAFGLAQWHPDRQNLFQRVFGTSIRNSTFEQQLAFVDWELRNNESRAGRLLAGATSVDSASNIFAQYYERPANSSSYGQRASLGKQILQGGKNLLDKTKPLLREGLKQGINSVFPGAGSIADSVFGGSIFGGEGEGGCGLNPICYLQQWIENSGFFQRLALATLAFILIIGALYLMKEKS